MRRGQAMIESMLAVVFTTFVLLFSIYIVRMLTAKILLDHAAARAARAKAVGFNDFMCHKAAQTALIPVAGKSLVDLSGGSELHRIPLYLASESPARARAVLDYEWWSGASLDIDEERGLAPSIDAHTRLETDSFAVEGAASIESHYPLYMNEF